MDEPKRIAIYARVSTTDQTPENQLLDLRRYCSARRWTIVEEFVDVAVSGAKKDRPSLGRLMEAARKRRLDGVLVWRFDRFARSVSHLVSALSEFKELGVGFASYTENIDTSTSQGKMVFAVIAAMAEFERDIITERIHAGIRRARSQGKRLGRPTLLSESQIADVRRLYSERRSVRQVAAHFGVSKSLVRNLVATNHSSQMAFSIVGE